MSDNDLLGDLFGSDSDDDDFQPESSPAKSPAKRAEEHAAERPEINDAKMRENQLKDLFGSDDEDDQNPAAEPSAAKEAAAPRERSPDGDGYYYRESSPAEEAMKGPPLTLDVPLHDVLANDPLRLAKLSNILGIEPRPFDPETYEPATTEYIDERGHQRVKLRDLNAIRWRWAPAEDGSIQRQSNARVVRWSDGSIQLFIGSEAMDIREVDVSGEQSYLYVRHPNLIQGQAQLQKKMVFRPASLESATHRRLREVVDRRNVRQQKVKATATLHDPKKNIEDRARAEESRIRDKEKLAERQQKQMRKYPTPGYRGSGGYGMLSAAYLEDDEDYEEDEDEDGEERTERGALAQIRARMGKGRGPMDEDEEQEAVRRLNAAKAGGTPGKGGPKGGVVESEEEEDEDISDDEDDLKDFIVDEEDEDEEGRGGGLDDDEEDEDEGPGSGGKRKGDERDQPQAKRRAVVFDSDSE